MAGKGLEGQCVSFGQSIPFLPLVDQLRKNFRIEELDGEPEIIAKVEHGMRRMGELEPHVPFVRYLLSVDPGDATIGRMDAAGRRQLVFAALRALTLRGAPLRPLIAHLRLTLVAARGVEQSEGHRPRPSRTFAGWGAPKEFVEASGANAAQGTGLGFSWGTEWLRG